VVRKTPWSYVTWYHERTNAWATWTPGEPVQPGDVGFFNEDRQFQHEESLKGTYEIKFELSPPRSLPDEELHSSDGMPAVQKFRAVSSAGFKFLAHLQAGFKAEAMRKDGFVLYMGNRTEESIAEADIRKVKDEIRRRLAQSAWDIDAVVVVSRIEARSGLAAVSSRGGITFEAGLDGGVHVGQADAATAGLSMAASREIDGVDLYPFGPGSTPVITKAFRVRRDLWDRLLPWRPSEHIESDSGRVSFGGKEGGLRLTSRYLRGLLPEERRFDPARSEITLAELSAISLDGLFEDVATLPDEPEPERVPELVRPRPGRTTWFGLPDLLISDRVAAADPSSRADPLLRVTADSLSFDLHPRDLGNYRLRVTLISQESATLLVAVRYRVGADSNTVLVPLVDRGRGQPNALVMLRGFELRSHWERSLPFAPADFPPWGAEFIEPSVQAADTEGTLSAWDQVVAQIPREYAERLARALRARGHPR